jgi:hypothetical protein
MCKTAAKITYYNMTLISTLAPTEGKDQVAKEECHSSLEKVCDAVPIFVMKTVIRGFNPNVGKASYFTPSMWRAQSSQRNGKLVVNFSL